MFSFSPRSYDAWGGEVLFCFQRFRYAEHRGVHISDEAVYSADMLSRRYITCRQLPDKAIDLLDTAAARVSMSLNTVPDAFSRLAAQENALVLEEAALLEDQAVPDDRLTEIAQQTRQLTTEQ